MAKVFFTKEITPENMVKMYDALGVKLPGKVAVKLHSGEVGNQNFIRPEFMEPVIGHVNGTIVECNTAYEGARSDSKEHWKTMDLHGWTKIADVDIMDEDGEMGLPVQGGTYVKTNFVGDHIKNYDSMLVLSHFKGHPMGGFGGALKNISIGIASAHGKGIIHGAGDDSAWSDNQNAFLISMAEAAKSIVDYYGDKIVYISVMCNMSVDCDCCAVAEDPKVGDMGILASTDPVALDQACLDILYASDDAGKADLIERIESRNGKLIVETAYNLKAGDTAYELVELNS